MNDEPKAWLTFTIRGSERGAEASRLARVLDELSGTFFTIARERQGKSSRSRRRTVEERDLAAVRVLRVLPGSTSIELLPPPSAYQATLDALDATTPDDVALEFYEEVHRVQTSEPVPVDRLVVHRRVRRLLREAGGIGPTAEITFQPLQRRPTFPSTDVLRAEVPTRELPKQVEISPTRRMRRMSGHAYMVDVERGRQRIRIKLPDNRDVTLDVDEQLIDRIQNVLDQIVDVDVEEVLEGPDVERRVVQDVRILPGQLIPSEPTKPPKTIEELALEQGIPPERPDYVALASRIWTSKEESEEFDRRLRDLRGEEP